MISFPCPSCGHRMQVAVEREVLCPACSHVVQVPSSRPSGPMTQAPASKQQARSSVAAVLGSGCLGLFLGVLAGGLLGSLWGLREDRVNPTGNAPPNIPWVAFGAVVGPVIGGFLGWVAGLVWGGVRDHQQRPGK
jgi:hypothetical protein